MTLPPGYPVSPPPLAPDGAVPRYYGAYVVSLVFKGLGWLTLLVGGLVTWRLPEDQSTLGSTRDALVAGAVSVAITIFMASALFFFAYVLQLLRAAAENTQRTSRWCHDG